MGYRVAYPGPSGTDAGSALGVYMPDAQGVACQSIKEAFEAAVSGETDLAFVPVENVIKGRYAQTLDNLLLYSDKIKIVGAFIASEGHEGEKYPDATAAGQDKTRYILLGRHKTRPTGRDVTSMIIYPKRDRVKLLFDLLGVISSRHNLNMTDIDRRPDKKGLSVFYIDIEGHIEDKDVGACISEIGSNLKDTDIIVLGSYPYLPFNEPLIKTIGIIGGTGEMGRFFIPFYEGLGYKVIVAGRKTPVTHIECAKTADAVIVNVPIDHTEETIKKIGPVMKKGQILIDNTGVKSRPVSAMLEYASREVEVLSIHTMFGPDIDDLSGQNIISIHTERSGAMAREFEDILYKYGANITLSTPEQHDMFVTFTQGLEHVDGIAKLSTILELAGHPDNLTSFSTPNSRKSAEIYERIHNGDSHLYATMIRENPFIFNTLDRYVRRLSDMVHALKAKDFALFEKIMEENRSRLGRKG